MDVSEPGRGAGASLLVAVTVGALLAYAWSRHGTCALGAARLQDGQSAQAGEVRVGQAAMGNPGPVSIGFAQDMSMHHEQALLMARMALANGTPQVRLLAEGIVNQQLKEIGYMQGWLLLWNAPAAADADDMRWMKEAYLKTRRRDEAFEQFISRCSTGQGMPGMATSLELDALSTLHGAKFDRQFLTLMVRHHEGALVMARFGLEFAEMDAVKGFASAMAAEQRQEMALMMRLLLLMGGA